MIDPIFRLNFTSKPIRIQDLVEKMKLTIYRNNHNGSKNVLIKKDNQ